ncbi:flagellar basal body P-ring formation chaperone FlgA [Roseibium sp. HPY-6]|uniref:flagellar basal body P-ring formation chaperone FlgA n=1 Tax=Roseibium sp. HPY-6 TaxID=3229852 RepID=UPI00338D7403
MMKHLYKAAIGLLLTGFASGAVLAEEPPVLRSQVMTLSEIVTVGDFYSNAGLHASKPLFRSPDMGTSGNVAASIVAERARAAGLEAAGTDGLRSVVVHRGATKIDRDQLESLVRNALAGRNAALAPDALDVRLLQAPDRVLADPKVADPIRFDRIEWSETNGHFVIQASVAIEHGTERLTLSGVAHEMVDVTVLAQPLRRGDLLKEEDLTSIRLMRSKVPAGALLAPEEIVGKEAKTNIRANTPLSHRSFQRPVLVNRGDKVTVTFNMPGVKLTSRAKALDPGAKGDVIDVMNLQSRRIVPATVTSRGQVRVHAANPVVASLNSETN